ncbi:MAG: hypothetical protein R2747_02470 [Pyrinomonadaceae bacterium]
MDIQAALQITTPQTDRLWFYLYLFTRTNTPTVQSYPNGWLWGIGMNVPYRGGLFGYGIGSHRIIYCMDSAGEDTIYELNGNFPSGWDFPFTERNMQNPPSGDGYLRVTGSYLPRGRINWRLTDVRRIG